MNVSLDTILAIVGIALSGLLGYLGIKYTFRFRNKTEIIFLKNASISLFETIVKNIDDIEIKYLGRKVDENLVLFKGTFFNLGNVDIEKSIIHKPLELVLPENYNWVMCKIIDSSNGLEISCNLIDNKVVFQWDLLKDGEYFTFDCLVEQKFENDNLQLHDIKKEIFNDFKVNHRITNLKDIKKESTFPKPINLVSLFFMSVVLFFVVCLFSYYSFGQLLFPKFELLTEVNLHQKNTFVKFIAENENIVKLLDIDNNIVAKYPREQLSSIKGNSTRIYKAEISYWQLYIFGFISLAYLFIWIILVFSVIRSSSLYKKIRDVAEKYNTPDKGRELGVSLLEIILK
ncbi:hypothetical protein [Sphingobacterium multivorum]|uniref:hypothetical protein n=1 Tax=Sphingobacterium multivorum TaxID=28454 RepID=UPI0031BA3EEC